MVTLIIQIHVNLYPLLNKVHQDLELSNPCTPCIRRRRHGRLVTDGDLQIPHDLVETPSRT
jgi:hypothetical protein